MSAQKSDCADFQLEITRVSNLLRSDYDRARWPDYVLRITDAPNAAEIILAGQIACRNVAEAQGLTLSENADLDIIRNTDEDVHDFVRLYFRPRTPTFHVNEGIRPTSERQNAHCAIPVAFLFDAASVLCLPETQFSNGNLGRWAGGRRALRGSTASDFRRLPFDAIYDDRPPYLFTDDEWDRAKFHRNAEVIVPDVLPLNPFLKHIYVRTSAERDTLLSLIQAGDASTAAMMRTTIQVHTKRRLFVKRWTFVERLSITEDQIALHVNPDSEASHPFTAEFFFEDPLSKQVVSHETRVIAAPMRTIRQAIPNSCRNQPFLFRLILDDCLAYQNTIDPQQDVTVSL